jgi:16S rRNA (guanine527-N7)-methyltransferase
MSRPDSDLSTAVVARSLEAAGLALPERQIGALAQFLQLLTRWNRVYNLTGVRESSQLVERHIVESLALKPLLQGRRIADVGTGAGLPGVPLAITEPERQFTLIDSRLKRVRFLRHAVAELGLGNVEIVHSRAEHLRPDLPFDTVLARAVAPPAELLAICRPLTAPGSILLLLTATHLREAFDGLAPDWLVRGADTGSVDQVEQGPKSTIVRLERTDG